MIKQNNLPNIEAYSFVGGMRNVAWVAGYARNFETEEGRVTRLLVQQMNNMNLALPVEFGPKVRLGQGFADTYPIKLTCHIEGARLDNGERVAVLRAISAETPTLLDMPGIETWDKIIPKGAPVDDFKPVSRNGEPGAKGSNVVSLAGLVYSAALATDDEGRTQSDCLIVLLRQHADPDKAIPIRVYGKYAKPYLTKATPGLPVCFTGEYRVRVKVVRKGEDGEMDQVVKYPYIHASHVRAATPREIKSLPDWALEMMERLREAKKGKQGRESTQHAQVATGGHPRIVVSNPQTPAVARPSDLDDDDDQPEGEGESTSKPNFGEALD